MKTSKTIFLSVTMLLCINAYSQDYFAIEIGIDINKVTNKENRSWAIPNCFGWSGRFSFEKFLTDTKFGISGGINFIQKNHFTYQVSDLIYEKQKCTYLSLPVYLDYQIKNGKLRMYISAGISLNYWIIGRITGHLPNIYSVNQNLNTNIDSSETIGLIVIENNYKFNPFKDKRLELSVNAGMRVQYPFHKQQFFIKYEYLYSINSQEKKTATNYTQIFNKTSLISFGVFFNLR